VFLIGFPLLIIPLAIYNMIAFLTPGVLWTDKVITARLVSGAEWTMTFGDALLTLALLLLLIEIFKAARAGAKSLVDHFLSLLVFMLAAAEFVMVSQAASSTFLMLCLVCLVDALGGFSLGRRKKLHAISDDIPDGEKAQP
jgi:steroid 5-alpha reductase family enzyme